MDNKEEPISPYNGSGHVDLTPYCAVLSIVIKQKKAKKVNKKYSKKSQKKGCKPLILQALSNFIAIAIKLKEGVKMASPIVFKIRVYNSNFKNIAGKNRAHLFYIAKRSGVSLNEKSTHGLFGKINDTEFGEIKDINAAANYVSKKCQEKTHCYRGVISMKEGDAIRLGYENKEDWQKLLHSNIYEIAEKVGIQPSNLDYCAAVHMEKRHPHLHYMFWEKEQGVKKPWVSPKTANDIRIKLIKNIFKDELAELHAIKNESRKVLGENAEDFFKSFFEPYQNMSKKEYEKAIEDLRKNPDNAFEGFTNFNMSADELESFALRIFEFRDKLPTTGRINFQFLPPELKEEIKDIVCDLVDYNEDFKKECDKYIETNVKLAEYFIPQSNETTKGDESKTVAHEKARQNAEDEIIKRLSNKLLTGLKNLDRSNNNASYKKSATLKLLTDLFSFLFAENKQSRSEKIGDNKRELSKQAKKELAIKMENAAAIEWEDEYDR